MNDKEILQNADFLEIALEEMEEGTVEYEFVEDVYYNLIEFADR
jgi:DNA-directed RNA polymerase subunit K/omega